MGPWGIVHLVSVVDILLFSFAEAEGGGPGRLIMTYQEVLKSGCVHDWALTVSIIPNNF